MITGVGVGVGSIGVEMGSIRVGVDVVPVSSLLVSSELSSSWSRCGFSILHLTHLSSRCFISCLHKS
jgi:hypothetical protein